MRVGARVAGRRMWRLAERSRRLGLQERAGAAGRGAPAVSPWRCGASPTPLGAYSQQ